MQLVQEPNEQDSPLARKEAEVQEHWFRSLPEPHRRDIIKREFDKAHKTHNEKRAATKAYESSKSVSPGTVSFPDYILELTDEQLQLDVFCVHVGYDL